MVKTSVWASPYDYVIDSNAKVKANSLYVMRIETLGTNIAKCCFIKGKEMVKNISFKKSQNGTLASNKEVTFRRAFA